MRKRKLYLSELLKRNKNVQLDLTIVIQSDTKNTSMHFETTKDVNAMQYHNCEVKHWRVIKTAFGYSLIVYL